MTDQTNPIDDFFTSLDIPADEPFTGGNQAEPTGAGQSPPAPVESAPAPSAAPPAPTHGTSGSESPVETSAPAAGQPAPMVPVAALVAERKKWQEELAARDARLAELEQRLPKPPPEPEPTPPDFLEDPKGYVDAQVKQALDKLNKVEQRTTQLTEEQQQAAQFAAFAQQVDAAQREFASKTADYQDALTHVRTARYEQLKVLAPDADDAAIVRQIQMEELAFAKAMLDAQRNPAEAIYQYARTLGYQPKQAAPAAGSAGAAPPAAGIPAFQPNAAAAARTLGASGGTPPAADPTQDGLGDGLDVFDAALQERFGRR